MWASEVSDLPQRKFSRVEKVFPNMGEGGEFSMAPLAQQGVLSDQVFFHVAPKKVFLLFREHQAVRDDDRVGSVIGASEKLGTGEVL